MRHAVRVKVGLERDAMGATSEPHSGPHYGLIPHGGREAGDDSATICVYLGAAEDDEAVRAGVVGEVARHHAPRVLLLVDHARDRKGSRRGRAGRVW